MEDKIHKKWFMITKNGYELFGKSNITKAEKIKIFSKEKIVQVAHSYKILTQK